MVHGLETMTAMNDAATSKVKRVVVCNDDHSGSQALYVDGKFMMSDSAIYAHDIENGVGGSDVPFVISQRDFISIGDENAEWPERLEDVKECE